MAVICEHPRLGTRITALCAALLRGNRPDVAVRAAANITARGCASGGSPPGIPLKHHGCYIAEGPLSTA